MIATATIAAIAGGGGLGDIIVNQATYGLAGVVARLRSASRRSRFAAAGCSWRSIQEAFAHARSLRAD